MRLPAFQYSIRQRVSGWANRMMLQTTGVVLGLVLGVGPAQAAELHWSANPYSHYSDQEPIGEVLKSLLAAQGIPLVVSDQVQDRVSARFEHKPPEQAFADLMQTYNLTWYYDGHVLYVYRLDEIRTASLRLQFISVADFRAALARLGILDSRFSWDSSEPDGLIRFAGPPALINLIQETAKALDRQTLPGVAVYKWEDPKGVMNFSSRPPAAAPGPVEVIPLQIRPITDTDPVIRPPAPTPSNPPLTPAVGNPAAGRFSDSRGYSDGR